MYLHTKFYEAHTLQIFEPITKVGMNVHWYLVYNSLNIGLLQSQTCNKNSLLGTDLV